MPDLGRRCLRLVLIPHPRLGSRWFYLFFIGYPCAEVVLSRVLTKRSTEG